MQAAVDRAAWLFNPAAAQQDPAQAVQQLQQQHQQLQQQLQQHQQQLVQQQAPFLSTSSALAGLPGAGFSDILPSLNPTLGTSAGMPTALAFSAAQLGIPGSMSMPLPLPFPPAQRQGSLVDLLQVRVCRTAVPTAMVRSHDMPCAEMGSLHAPCFSVPGVACLCETAGMYAWDRSFVFNGSVYD